MKLHFISMLLFLHLPAASATSFHAESIESFTVKSKHIVRGTVKRQQVEKTTAADGTVILYTYALIEVKEPLKGGITRNEIRVRRLGGETEGYHHEVPGSPEFKENEDTVLFLTGEQEDGSYEIESMEMGKFGLRSENGSEVLTGGMLQYLRQTGAPSSKPVTLETLKGIIRATTVTMPAGPASTAPAGSSASTVSSSASGSRNEESPSQPATTAPDSDSNPGFKVVIGLILLLAIGWIAVRIRKKH